MKQINNYYNFFLKKANNKINQKFNKLLKLRNNINLQ